MNTGFVRGLGYSPSRMLLSYNLRRQEPTSPPLRNVMLKDMLNRVGADPESCTPEAIDYAVRLAQLGELRNSALDNLSEQQRRRVEARNKPNRERDPVSGDPVILRRVVNDKEKGHKLEPSWVGPYFVTRVTKMTTQFHILLILDRLPHIGCARHVSTVIRPKSIIESVFLRCVN